MGPAISYYDGCVVESNFIALLGKLDVVAHDNYSHSRRFSYLGKSSPASWGAKDMPWMANSICQYRPVVGKSSRATCTLGLMSGIVELGWKDAGNETEFLPGAKELGGLLHLKQIRQVGEDLYVVGSRGQVYRRHQNSWIVFNQGLEVPDLNNLLNQGINMSDALDQTMGVLDLESIDGISPMDIYAVGSRGGVYFRGGDRWIQLKKVTNVNLHRVRVLDSNTIYAVGDRGVVLKGNAQQGFSVIETNIGDDLWGLEWFGNYLYVGGKLKGLFRLDDQSLQKVASLPDFECHTLHSYANQLLALGSKHVYLTDDAKSWKFLQNPDNG
jgi:hypothetical protein